MARQRTISDQGFWRSPKLQGCTTEDKVTLLHLLTCPDSNIVGAYPIIARIAAAELGWSQEQWLQVMERLVAEDLTWHDKSLSFVWVRVWWEHHNPGQAMGPKLRARTVENLRALPQHWLEPFLADFKSHLSAENIAVLDTALATKGGRDTVSIPYLQTVDTSSADGSGNNNSNGNSKKTATLGRIAAGSVDISAVPVAHRSEVKAALSACLADGTAVAEPQAILDAVARQFRSTSSPPRSAGALTRHLARHLAPEESPKAHAPQVSDEELAALKGRCFAWPTSDPTTFIQVIENGQFDHFSREGGAVVRSTGWLQRSDLVKPIQEGRIREVSPALIAEIAREATR